MQLINGVNTSQLSSLDRGLQFGDGCFTTAQVNAGKVRFLTHHLARLAHDSQRLGIQFDAWPELAQEINMLAQQSDLGVIKILLTRGVGGRGYSAADCTETQRILSLAPYPTHYAAWQQQGVTLITSPIPLGMNPYLAGIKHLNRLEQVLIKNYLDRQGAQEALVLDSQGNVVECCAANILWRKGQQIFTPALTHSGVEGIMKGLVIEALQAEGYHCRHVTQAPTALEQADEVIICNALMPVLPVTRIDQWHYHPGEAMATLIKLGFTAS
ncbi:4-amino-4-deoxychorismate lyase [Rosenbergiella nectarea]|uniref:Aminodeoxychorismate lyase n=1 Tax=Rosenbergiella nectarea TaxID=988801 RepID=A0A1H9LUI0_9GAMM|nr:aminodeoxychorismate lyase [Rosenbergiella nectarea]SER15080.1 4-amino-4-deoxychorismate lyase [Rosenbergiella nectarea]